MIFLDDRVGSRHLKKYLPRTLVRLTRMEFADAAWVGRGPSGAVSVGVEIKTLGDLISSLMTQRFQGHQLPGLIRDYDYRYLIVEGLFRPSQKQMLEVPRGRSWVTYTHAGQRITYPLLSNWLTTIEILGQTAIRRSADEYETALIILNLHRWWTNKDFDDHRGHLGKHMADRPVTVTRPSWKMRVISELPGIGWKKAKEVGQRFETVADLLEATEDEWMEIKGIGKATARNIIKEIKE